MAQKGKLVGNLLRQNRKMAKSSNDKYIVVNWTLPAVKTCPAAGHCKIGCYATQGAYIWSNVRSAHESNWKLAKNTTKFIAAMSKDIQQWLDKAKRGSKQLVVRVHDAGDYYDLKYLQAWLEIMSQFPSVTFYSYTKQVKIFKKLKERLLLPMNFCVIYSYGGIYDHLIDPSMDRHSAVFGSMDELVTAGYVDTTANDLNAIGDNHRIGLVYHGANSKQWTSGASYE